jgi:hypothetical protein
VTVHSLDLTRSGLIAALAPAAPAHEPHRRLAAAIELCGNDDALARRSARAACNDGRPAFWTTATYHSQKACVLHLAVHTEPTLEAAVECAYGPHTGTELRHAAFDTLIPLNAAAMEALALAYARLGRLPDVAELETRSMLKVEKRGRYGPPLENNVRPEEVQLDEWARCAFPVEVTGESAAGQARGKS